MATRRSTRAVAGTSATSIDSAVDSPKRVTISSLSTQTDSPALATRSKKIIHADLQTLSQTLENNVPSRKRRLTESPIPQNKPVITFTKDGSNSDETKKSAAQKMGARLSRKSNTIEEKNSPLSDNSHSEDEGVVGTSSHIVDEKKAVMVRRTRLQEKGTAKKIEFSSEESEDETETHASRPRRSLRSTASEKSSDDKKVEESSDDSKNTRSRRSVKPQLATVNEEVDKEETVVTRRSLSLKQQKELSTLKSDSSSEDDDDEIPLESLLLHAREQFKSASSSDDLKNKTSLVPKVRSSQLESSSEEESSDASEVVQKKKTPAKSITPTKASTRKQASSSSEQDSESDSDNSSKEIIVPSSKGQTSGYSKNKDINNSSDDSRESFIAESTDLEEGSKEGSIHNEETETTASNRINTVENNKKSSPKQLTEAAYCEDEKMESDKNDSGDSQSQDNTPFFNSSVLESSDSEVATKDQQEDVDFFANNSDVSTEAYVEEDSADEVVKSRLKQLKLAQAPKELTEERTPKSDEETCKMSTYLRVDLLKDPKLDKFAQEIAQKSPEETSTVNEESNFQQIKSPISSTKPPVTPAKTGSPLRAEDKRKTPTPKKNLFVSLSCETSPPSEKKQSLSPLDIGDKLQSPRSPFHSLEIEDGSKSTVSPVAEKLKSPTPDRSFSKLTTPLKLQGQSKTPTPSKESSVIKSSSALTLKSPPTTPTKMSPNKLSQERNSLENVQSNESAVISNSPKVSNIAVSLKSPQASESESLPISTIPSKKGNSVLHFNLKLSPTIAGSVCEKSSNKIETPRSPQKSPLQAKSPEKQKELVQLTSSSESENMSDSSNDSGPEESSYIKESMNKQKSILSDKSKPLRKVEIPNNLNKSSNSSQRDRNAQIIESEKTSTPIKKVNPVEESSSEEESSSDNEVEDEQRSKKTQRIVLKNQKTSSSRRVNSSKIEDTSSEEESASDNEVAEQESSKKRQKVEPEGQKINKFISSMKKTQRDNESSSEEDNSSDNEAEETLFVERTQKTESDTQKTSVLNSATKKVKRIESSSEEESCSDNEMEDKESSRTTQKNKSEIQKLSTNRKVNVSRIEDTSSEEESYSDNEEKEFNKETKSENQKMGKVDASMLVQESSSENESISDNEVEEEQKSQKIEVQKQKKKKIHSAEESSSQDDTEEEPSTNMSVSSNESKKNIDLSMWAMIRKQRKERLEKQLKAMRNWQVTVIEPEPEENDHTESSEKSQVEAKKSKKKSNTKQVLQSGAQQYIEMASYEAEQSESEEEKSPPPKKSKKKDNKNKVKESQESESQKKKPKLQPQTVELESDDDAPEELTFDAGKSSAFEVFTSIALARKQERDKKIDKQRKKQERMQAEREQKQLKTKHKSSVLQTNGHSLDDSANKSKKKTLSQASAYNGEKQAAKLPLNILEKLSAQPELSQANSNTIKAKKKKKNRKHKMNSQTNDRNNDEPKEKKSKKDFIPLSSTGSTQFAIAPLNVVPTSILAPANKVTAWRNNRFHGKKVKRHSMSEIKAIEEKKKYKNY